MKAWSSVFEFVLNYVSYQLYYYDNALGSLVKVPGMKWILTYGNEKILTSVSTLCVSSVIRNFWSLYLRKSQSNQVKQMRLKKKLNWDACRILANLECGHFTPTQTGKLMNYYTCQIGEREEFSVFFLQYIFDIFVKSRVREGSGCSLRQYMIFLLL